MTSKSQARIFIQNVNNLTLLGRWRISFREEREGRRVGVREGLTGGEKCIVVRPNSVCWKEAYKNSECLGSFQGCKVRFAECFCPWINWPAPPLKNFTCPKGLLITLTTAPCQGQMVRHATSAHSQVNVTFQPWCSPQAFNSCVSITLFSRNKSDNSEVSIKSSSGVSITARTAHGLSKVLSWEIQFAGWGRAVTGGNYG